MNTPKMNNNQQTHKGLHIVLWVVQIILAVLFVMAGSMKVMQPIETLHTMMPWTTAVSDMLVRVIGTSEVLGGLGLIIPSALRIKPNLTVWAAMGLTLVQILAVIFHISRAEFFVIPINCIFIALGMFIFWGRKNKLPISAR